MNNSHAKTLICIVGPTAVGKTELGLRIAQHYNTEIVSADSRQFYREMSVGTAKPTPGELNCVVHHFIDNLSIEDSYSAGQYEIEGLACLEELFKKHHEVVLVGGSGLFVNALCFGLDQLPQPGANIRESISLSFREKGIEPLQERLRQCDPDYFQEVDIHNPQRVIRALEVFESTGIPFSEWRRKQFKPRNFNIKTIGLTMERENLYNRINVRVDRMMENGLLQEVSALLPYRERPPLQSVGYTELFNYLDGKTNLKDAIDKIKQNTRRYAKRQLTWFRKNPDTKWIDAAEINGLNFDLL